MSIKNLENSLLLNMKRSVLSIEALAAPMKFYKCSFLPHRSVSVADKTDALTDDRCSLVGAEEGVVK